nr:hypothetical protein [Tanacetum cinerariifolium]
MRVEFAVIRDTKKDTPLNPDVTKNGPPAKILWYLSIGPRLERLFSNEKDAKLLRWHAEGHKRDGKMRHVADSLRWRNIDNEFKEFGDEIRNIRFGLSFDGIYPFGNMNSRHSTWPVLLCIYNLPPWLCMKQKYIMMSLLIQGHKQPGNNINVYLKLLIKDMQDLWSPRLERLFSNEKDAKLLRWHAEGHKRDGKMRHVADSLRWRNIDNEFKEFGDEIRNIRFGLSFDGIYPFGNMNSRHSTWPVLLCIYNLPPWLCMKQKYIMMSLLIQGHKQPGNNINVYLKLLIKDMQDLWSKGVEVYDAYKKETFQMRAMIFCTLLLWSKGVEVYDAYKKETFQMRAMIFCTISDFSSYGNLSGYKTKRKMACPEKTKDGVKVQKDMEAMKIRPELAPREIVGKTSTYLPPACYTMSKAEKTKFCQC